jgi:MFS family permease
MKNEYMKSRGKAGLFGDTYYGWVIVAVALISMAFWFGIRTSFSVFYVALLEDFTWTRAGSAGIQSMALITYTVLAPIVGGLIDRFGPRRVIGPGILVLTIGLILCSLVNTLFQFYIFYGLIIGVGVTCISIVPYTAILGHWFEKKRGLASGIAVSGMGLGTFILVPLSQHFINVWGWRFTFVILGVLVLIVLLPLNVALLRHKPQELGLLPDGLEMVKSSNGKNLKEDHIGCPEGDWTLQRALRTGNFWALVAFPFLAAIGVYFIIVHHVKFLVDMGIDKMTAAFIFALIGVISSCFRIFWGWLSDHIGREKTYTMGVICMCVGVGSLLLIGAMDEKWLVYVFFIFFGIGWGVTAPIFMATAADLFKGKVFGLIYGIVEGCLGIGGAFGAWIGGYVFDRTQSYQWAFVLAIVVFLLSGLFIWIAAPRKIHKTEYNGPGERAR